jgi:tungstate transport system substrate-binding protein
MFLNINIHHSIFFIVLLLVSCAKDNGIKVGLTSTLEDSGAIAVLTSEFKKEHGINIKAVIAGSGQIHRLIESGDIDTAITHDPSGEKKLIEKGVVTQRLPLVSNDYLIVGPVNDPAHVKHAITPDEALQKIAYTKQLFVSRNDNSGTHQMENNWREKIRIKTNESLIIKTGTGMGATLTVAAEKQAYTLVDRGTWLNFNNKQQLKILFEDPEQLPNDYSVLSFSSKNEKKDRIDLWENWLTKGNGMTLLKKYQINGKPVFNIQ